MSKQIKLYILNMCILVYINYTQSQKKIVKAEITESAWYRI